MKMSQNLKRSLVSVKRYESKKFEFFSFFDLGEKRKKVEKRKESEEAAGEADV